MPVYRYKGIASPNRRVSASIDADSLRGARAKLKGEGVYLTWIEEGRTRSSASELLSRFRITALQRVPDLALSMLTGQLSL